MARGITQDEVWKACDALLLEGARPTIERVRLKLGRGSPNTVSPMLETWFKQLGARIKDPGAFATAPDLPDPIQQAAKHFWEVALAQTRLDFDERLREGMAAAVANVQAEQERAATAQAAAFEAASRAARLEGDLQARTHELHEERERRAAAEARLGDTEERIKELQLRLDGAASETTEVRAAARQEVLKSEERADAVQRRALLDIDTERRARVAAEKRAEAAERKWEAAVAGARDAQASSADALRVATANAERLRTELSGALTARDEARSEAQHLSNRASQSEREAERAKGEAAAAHALLLHFEGSKSKTPHKRGTRA